MATAKLTPAQLAHYARLLGPCYRAAVRLYNGTGASHGTLYAHARSMALAIAAPALAPNRTVVGLPAGKPAPASTLAPTVVGKRHA